MRLRILAAMVACAVPCAHAESLYVVEQLFVTVNAAPDGTGERVAQIKSGDRVEVLERQGEQARVRLASGTEGWVRANYLSADPPLREQLSARSDELERVRKEKAQLETELASARSAAKAAAEAAVASAQPAEPAARHEPPHTPTPTPAAEPLAPAETSATAAPETLSSGAPPMFGERPFFPARPSWWVMLGATAGALIVGFALGWRMLDRRIRAKYGGLRIY